MTDDDGNVRVWAAFLGVVEPPSAGSTPMMEKFSEVRKAKLRRAFITADTSEGEIDGRRVGKNISARAQGLILSMRKLPVIMIRILPGRENIHDFRGTHPHHRPKDNAVDESEDC